MYECKSDEQVTKSHSEEAAKPPRSGPSPQGPTNPDLLKAKEATTVRYLLSALERFEVMPRERVSEIAKEIGIRGMEGIDYASSERAYTLRALPGETFGGLQLLAIMYVAFKIVEPLMDMGLDFEDAYEEW